MGNRNGLGALLEAVWVEEVYPEGRVAARVNMRRDPRDRSLHYTASALRTLDRLRAVLQDATAASSPGHLRTLRESLGLTQQQFARRLGVTSQTVSRWERGEVRPGAAVVRKLRGLQKSARRAGIAVSRAGVRSHAPAK